MKLHLGGDARLIVSALTISAACALSGAVQAEELNYPTRSIRLVVPYPPGGGTDLTARAVSQQMAVVLGQALVIENKPGATGMIGANAVVTAQPDGYTVLFGAASEMAINASLYKNMAYDPQRQLVPVSLVATFPLILVAPAQTTESLPELLAQAKKQPGTISYGSIGAGSPQHLAAELMAARAGVVLLHVPYKGSGPLVQASLGGQVHIGVSSVPPAVQLIQAGKLRALALTSSQRLDALPQVPTMSEFGFAGYEFGTWSGLAVPVGTPRRVIERLNQSVIAAISVPEVLKTLAEQGAVPIGSTPEYFEKFIQAEIEKSKMIVLTAKIALE